MVQSRKRKLTFSERGNFTVVIAILLSLAVLTTLFYYFPTGGKTYAEYSEEYKHVAIAISQDSKEGKFSATLGGRGTYTITKNGEEKDIYYYSTDYEKKTVTVNDYLDVLSYVYSMELGEGILNGYVGKRVILAAFPATVLTLIEFLVGVAALGIAALPRCFKRMRRRRKSNLKPDKIQT